VKYSVFTALIVNKEKIYGHKKDKNIQKIIIAFS